MQSEDNVSRSKKVCLFLDIPPICQCGRFQHATQSASLYSRLKKDNHFEIAILKVLAAWRSYYYSGIWHVFGDSIYFLSFYFVLFFTYFIFYDTHYATSPSSSFVSMKVETNFKLAILIPVRKISYSHSRLTVLQ